MSRAKREIKKNQQPADLPGQVPHGIMSGSEPFSSPILEHPSRVISPLPDIPAVIKEYVISYVENVFKNVENSYGNLSKRVDQIEERQGKIESEIRQYKNDTNQLFMSCQRKIIANRSKFDKKISTFGEDVQGKISSIHEMLEIQYDNIDGRINSFEEKINELVELDDFLELKHNAWKSQKDVYELNQLIKDQADKISQLEQQIDETAGENFRSRKPPTPMLKLSIQKLLDNLGKKTSKFDKNLLFKNIEIERKEEEQLYATQLISNEKLIIYKIKEKESSDTKHKPSYRIAVVMPDEGGTINKNNLLNKELKPSELQFSEPSIGDRVRIMENSSGSPAFPIQEGILFHVCDGECKILIDARTVLTAPLENLGKVFIR